MADGTLTFAIPVRDPRGVADWDLVKRLLSSTVRSLFAQSGPVPQVVVGTSPGADLPTLPDAVTVVPVSLEYQPLPEPEGPARWEAIRADKGLRLAHALAAVRPGGHVMVVDYDDLVSRRLSAFVHDHPDAAGWFVDAGYLWGGGPVASLRARGFNQLCGSSLLIRADLLRLAEDPSDPTQLEWIKDTLGSHKKWHSLFPLKPLPFPGAVYRVGSGANVSGISGIQRRIRDSLRRPRALAGELFSLRPWAAVRGEFGC